jgi:hydrogenase maturation protease
MKDFLPVIERLAREKTCFVGVGNWLMSDDAAGLHVVDGLREGIRSKSVTAMNVEDVLENYVFSIAQADCDNVVLVDAVRSGAEPGSVFLGRLREVGEIIDNQSTHKLSLSLSGKLLEDFDKKVWFLGIEARGIDYGVGLSDEVKGSVRAIRDILLSYINCDQKEPVYEH